MRCVFNVGELVDAKLCTVGAKKESAVMAATTTRLTSHHKHTDTQRQTHNITSTRSSRSRVRPQVACLTPSSARYVHPPPCLARTALIIPHHNSPQATTTHPPTRVRTRVRYSEHAHARDKHAAHTHAHKHTLTNTHLASRRVLQEAHLGQRRQVQSVCAQHSPDRAGDVASDVTKVTALRVVRLLLLLQAAMKSNEAMKQCAPPSKSTTRTINKKHAAAEPW